MKSPSPVSANALADCNGTGKVLPIGWTTRHRVFVKQGLSLFVDGFVVVDVGAAKAGRRDEESFVDRLMNIYKLKGAAFLKRLRGSFALALWDAPARRLILAVDPFATRSLYYWSNLDRVAFAPRITCVS